MNTLLATLALALLACGGSHHQQCFECGLTDEWERAERERAERARASHEAHMAAIDRAVELGDVGTTKDAELISETVYQGDLEPLVQLVGSLERSCRPQHPLAMDWVLHLLTTGTLRRTGSDDITPLRQRAFYLIAVSRGDDARDGLGRCAGTTIEALCARALAVIDQGGHRCETPTVVKP